MLGPSEGLRGPVPPARRGTLLPAPTLAPAACPHRSPRPVPSKATGLARSPAAGLQPQEGRWEKLSDS